MQKVGFLMTRLICNTNRYLDYSLRLCFQLSARSEREFRALEVCEMMSDEHTLQLAIKYSSRMRFLQLAQRISEMAVRKAEEREAKAAGRYGLEIRNWSAKEKEINADHAIANIEDPDQTAPVGTCSFTKVV